MSHHHQTPFRALLLSTFSTLLVSITFFLGTATGAMTLPTDLENWRSMATAVSPVPNSNPNSAVPLGFGSAASGGNLVSLNAAFDTFSSPADIYVGVQADVLGPDIYLFTASNQFALYEQNGLVPWRTNSMGNFTASLGKFPVSSLPAGDYIFYILITPANQIDGQRGWVTTLQLGGSSPGGEALSMQEDLQNKLGMITDLGSSLDLTVLSQIFSDENVVQTTPAELSFAQLQSGTPITVSADFGSGYAAPDGSTWAGNAILQISNVRFDATGIGADISANFNNVTQDGTSLADGSLSGGVSLTPAANGSSLAISGNLAFTNLVIQGMLQNGAIGISGTIDGLSSETSGTIEMTMTSFTSGDYLVDSGNVVLTFSDTDVLLTAVMQTNDGPVDIGLQITPGASTDEMLLSTTAPGTIGPYTVSINDLGYATDNCSGSASFTDSSGSQIDIYIDEDCLDYSFIEH